MSLRYRKSPTAMLTTNYLEMSAAYEKSDAHQKNEKAKTLSTHP